MTLDMYKYYKAYMTVTATAVSIRMFWKREEAEAFAQENNLWIEEFYIDPLHNLDERERAKDADSGDSKG